MIQEAGQERGTWEAFGTKVWDSSTTVGEEGLGIRLQLPGRAHGAANFSLPLQHLEEMIPSRGESVSATAGPRNIYVIDNLVRGVLAQPKYDLCLHLGEVASGGKELSAPDASGSYELDCGA